MRPWLTFSPGEEAVFNTELTAREEEFLIAAAGAEPEAVIKSAAYWGLARVARLYATRLASTYFFQHGTRMVYTSALVTVKKRRAKSYEHDGPCTPLFSRGLCRPCYQRKYREAGKRPARRQVAA